MERIAKSTLPYFLGIDLADLAEGTPLSEESGFVDFMSEARGLTAAVKDAGICLSKTKDQRARALFLMRGFYLLGVIRGAEECRFSMMDEEEVPPRIFFSPDEDLEADFREALEHLPPELFQRLCALLGLSVPWEK